MPRELALGLRVRRPADAGHHDDARFAGEQPADEARDAHRLLGAELVSQCRQPLRDGSGIIVDHVEDTATAVLDRRRRRLRRIGDVDEGPHPGTVPDERELAPADQLELLLPRRHRRARPVEGAIAQDDPLRPIRREDRLFDVTDGGLRLPHLARGRQVQRVLFGLHRAAGAHVRGIAAHPLCHEPSHSDSVCGREQVVGPLRPQAVRQREIAIEMTHVDRTDRGQLMNDHIRPRDGDRLRDLIGIKRVRDHRQSAELVEHRPLGLAARHAIHLMTCCNQTRHQLPADRSRCTCHEHSHRQLHGRGFPTTIETTRQCRL
jgi:hypothetical protein